MHFYWLNLLVIDCGILHRWRNSSEEISFECFAKWVQMQKMLIDNLSSNESKESRLNWVFFVAGWGKSWKRSSERGLDTARWYWSECLLPLSGTINEHHFVNLWINQEFLSRWNFKKLYRCENFNRIEYKKNWIFSFCLLVKQRKKSFEGTFNNQTCILLFRVFLGKKISSRIIFLNFQPLPIERRSHFWSGKSFPSFLRPLNHP